MPEKNLSDDEAELVEAYRAANDPEVSERHLAITERLADEHGFTPEYLLEASADAVEAIAEVLLDGFEADSSAVTANEVPTDGPLEEVDVGTGQLDDIDGARRGGHGA